MKCLHPSAIFILCTKPFSLLPRMVCFICLTVSNFTSSHTYPDIGIFKWILKIVGKGQFNEFCWRLWCLKQQTIWFWCWPGSQFKSEFLQLWDMANFMNFGKLVALAEVCTFWSLLFSRSITRIWAVIHVIHRSRISLYEQHVITPPVTRNWG